MLLKDFSPLENVLIVIKIPSLSGIFTTILFYLERFLQETRMEWEHLTLKRFTLPQERGFSQKFILKTVSVAFNPISLIFLCSPSIFVERLHLLKHWESFNLSADKHFGNKLVTKRWSFYLVSLYNENFVTI